MKKILISGYNGEYFNKMSNITFPIMQEYALKYNIESALYELPLLGRPISWSKIPIIHQLLTKYDLVVWLDSDVVIKDQSEDITLQCNDNNIQYLANHNVSGNNNPNCGVWLLKKDMIPFLEKIWKMEKHIENCWWEQAALIEIMGYEVNYNSLTGNKVIFKDSNNELYKQTGKLDSKWNYCEVDVDRSQNPLFLHFAGFYDKLERIYKTVNREIT